MALTQYTADTDIIETLGTNPEDRPTLTDNTFKGKFDENAANIKAFLNAMIAELASTANGKGASQIGIEDSAGRYTATQIEAALAEIAGSGRTTETVKGLADLISTVSGNLATDVTNLANHKAEIVAHAELVNKTITVGVGKDFTTIQAAIDSIKKRVDATITINVDAGTYNESVNIAGFVGTGKITLNGDSVVSDTRKVNLINAANNVCNITVSGFRGLSTSVPTFSAINCLCYYLNYCKTIDSASQYGVVYDNSFGAVQLSLISNRNYGIMSMNCSTVFSGTNSGTGNTNGLGALNAATIGKYSTQPAGTTAETTAGGGVIR